LRETAPVWWNEQTDSIFDDGGYWVISRHEDIKAISRNGDLWSTNRKGAVTRMPDGTTSEQLELTKALLINHDAPEHTRLRKIVSRLFTPRPVATLEEKLAVAAREIVSAAAEKESGNFVDDIAMGLPLLAIADLIGVPAGPRPCTASSERRWPTPNSVVSRSTRAGAPACSTVRPITTKMSSSTPSDSISTEIPTRTWDSAATVRTTASARTWPAWRSS
jgi:cytochrome P450